jgi:DNA-binding FrmR family transcriptional regulator
VSILAASCRSDSHSAGVDSAGGLIQDGDECADILMLLAAIRGWVNSLMALAR